MVSLPKSFKDGKVHNFLSDLSMIGPRYIVDPDSPLCRRVLWTILVIYGLMQLGSLIYYRVDHYLSNPVAVNFRVVNQESMEFPEVTICKERPTGRDFAAQNNLDMTQYVSGLKMAQCLFATNGSRDGCLSANFSLDSVAFHAGHLRLFDEQANSVIQKCTCGFNDCDDVHKNYSTTTLTLDMYGCATVNTPDKSTNRRPFVATGAGYSRSIKLRLVTNVSDQLPPEYTETYENYGNGYQVIVNDGSKVLVMSDHGVKVPLGHETHISVTRLDKQLLPISSNCSEETDIVLGNFGGKNVKYDKNSCIFNCAMSAATEKCSCETKTEDVKFCSTVEQIGCFYYNVFKVILDGAKSICQQCQQSCRQTIYNVKLSSSAMSQPADLPPDHVVSSVAVYYDTLGYEVMEQLAAYSLSAMFSDIGGALGLLVGSCIYTLAEVADFFLLTVFFTPRHTTPRVRRSYRNRKQRSAAAIDPYYRKYPDDESLASATDNVERSPASVGDTKY